MSDETGNGDFALCCVSSCYAEVHISWEIEGEVLTFTSYYNIIGSGSELREIGFVKGIIHG